MPNSKYLLLIFAVFTFVLLSCNTTKNQVTETSPLSAAETLAQHYWKLVEVRGKRIENKGAGKKTKHITFNATDNTISGFAGCNQFNGQFVLTDNNQLQLEKIATTRKSCFRPTGEKEFLNLLEGVDNYTLVGTTLTFNKAKIGSLVVFESVSTSDVTR